MRGRGACFVTESMPSDACAGAPAPSRGRMPAAGLRTVRLVGSRGTKSGPGLRRRRARPRRHGAAATPCGREKLLAPHLASA